jgi:NADH-quinone oxidoreductase subunit J
MLVLLFILFAGMAIGCALAVVAQRNPLYSAISLIGVFISLACLYVMLAAPFIAAVQVIVYAGAIMVLVVFVIMLLNVEEEAHRRPRLKFLLPVAIALSAVLIAEVAFILVSVQESRITPAFDSVIDGHRRRDDTCASRRAAFGQRQNKARLSYGTTTFMVSRAFRRAVHDRRHGSDHQAQRDLDVHVHRADAEFR